MYLYKKEHIRPLRSTGFVFVFCSPLSQIVSEVSLYMAGTAVLSTV